MLKNLRRVLHTGPTMVTLATGGGKTGVAACLSSDYRRVLFLAPRRAIVDQAPIEFGKWDVQAVNASEGRWDHEVAGSARVIVASYRLASNRLKRKCDFAGFDLLIVDEAHHAADGKAEITGLVRDAHRNGLHILGLTATCWRLSKKEGFVRTWQQLLQFADWNVLHKEGWLAGCDLHLIGPEKAIRGGKPAGNGEYTNPGILALNKERPLFTKGAVDWWASAARHNRQNRWMSTICYAVGQTHAVNVARYFQKKGAKVGLILSDKQYLEKAPGGIVKDTAKAIWLFRNGHLDVLVNVQKVTEGFDAPSSECVLVLRPTMSVALWLQICGRGARLDKAKGKTKLLLLDATDNALRLHHPFWPRKWQLKPRGQISPGSLGPQRECMRENNTGCGAMMHTSQHKCATCLAPQGQNCPMCGRFTLWSAYKKSRSELCPACEAGRRMKWQKSWFRIRTEPWWKIWHEEWVSPDLPSRLPANSLYAQIRKDGIGRPWQVNILVNNGSRYRDFRQEFAGHASAKEMAINLAYSLYQKRLTQEFRRGASARHV